VRPQSTIPQLATSDHLARVVYTLWKRPGLLPFVSTPAAVIPVLVGGADLMIPGGRGVLGSLLTSAYFCFLPVTPVVHHSSALKHGQLVSITEHHGASQVGPPLAVGRMGVDLPLDGQEKEKGKAVLVLHTWKDWLWDMGSKGDVPLPTPLALRADGDKEGGEAEKESLSGAADEVDTMVGAIAVLGVSEDAQAEAASSPPPSAEDAVPQNTLTPQGKVMKLVLIHKRLNTIFLQNRTEVSEILHASLLQAIQTSLSTLPASSFPLSSSTFYTNHLLPSRPHHTTDASQTPIDIKHSTYKTLAAFLKHAEKGGLISLKSVGREKEVVVMGVAMDHPEVIGHRKHLSVREAEARKAKREEEEAEEREREREGGREMRIVQRWKPHGPSVRLLEAVGEKLRVSYYFPAPPARSYHLL
jgi:translation initiation factor 2D